MTHLDWYADLHGTNLFPCHKRVLNDPRSKTPLESGFYNRKYSRMSLEAYQDEGHGVGCSLGKHYLVMDVDVPTAQRPDKLGLESLERLIADTGLDLELVPCVESPSGGRHYYFRKPPQMKIRKVLKDYPGDRVHHREQLCADRRITALAGWQLRVQRRHASCSD
jgi:hypothetical protein